jgi:hypothetical protein
MKNELVSVVVSVSCIPFIVPAYIGYYLFFARHDKAPVKA